MFSENEMLLQANFVSSILAMAANFSISVTSWGRTKSHNAAVGGVSDSQHLQWTAVDIVRDPDCNKAKLLSWIEDNGLVAIDEPDHIHVMLKR